jgi:hypothetical protein
MEKLVAKTNNINIHVSLYLMRTYSEIIILRNLRGRNRPPGRSSHRQRSL